MIRQSIVVLIGLALLAGCGEGNDPPTGAQTAPGAAESASPASTATPSAAPTVSEEAIEFVRLAAIGGLFEVQSSELILEKLEQGDERAFAERMIADHGKANEELKQLAQSKNITIPTALDAPHQQKIEKLRGLEGDALAEAYHEMQQAAHEAAIALFENASQNLPDAELKAFAAKTLPTLRAHYKMLGAHDHHH